ncbi:MAG TPA: hypothetical protein VGT78_03570 [Rhizomicrobium sp.]|nr:hypothetical protein [Rhizomicrobium sp.]
MSNQTYTSPAIRWQLLSTVSAVALIASIYGTSEATAASNDADQPLIWIELGGQGEFTSGFGDPFVPTFVSQNPTSPVFQNVSPQRAQKLPLFSFGEDGKISFQPENSDWIFSAAIRYGRSSTNREVDHQTKGFGYEKYVSGQPKKFCTGSGGAGFCTTAKFSDTKARIQESHAILDFSAGKDVGLGIFGSGSTSVVSAGVRFAQFTSKASTDMRARPNMEFKYITAFAPYKFKLPHFNSYYGTGHASRDFHGVGPTLSWEGSAPFAGSVQNGEIELEWGANVAILFGKQKAHVRHQESARYVGPLHCALGPCYSSLYHHPSSGHPTSGHDTDRSVTVPNVGASLGISFRKGDAKVSFGYRADLFMNAMDTGIDVAKKSNVLFHGPYASISVGLGD